MSKLSTTDLALLVNELSDVTDPYKLGINLGITPARVTIILKEADGNIDRQKSEILTHWLKNDLDASWVKLAQTLRKIDHVRLANSLENKSRGIYSYSHYRVLPVPPACYAMLDFWCDCTLCYIC